MTITVILLQCLKIRFTLKEMMIEGKFCVFKTVEIYVGCQNLNGFWYKTYLLRVSLLVNMDNFGIRKYILGECIQNRFFLAGTMIWIESIKIQLNLEDTLIWGTRITNKSVERDVGCKTLNIIGWENGLLRLYLWYV